MTWSCPYLSIDGKCTLRKLDCEPLSRGCIIAVSGLGSEIKLVAKEEKKMANKSKKVAILQHVPNENAGTLLSYLNEENIPFNTVHFWKNDYLLPDLDTVSALIVMGGPMNVYEDAKYPFLKREDEFIKEAVKGEIPYLGICLGAQLLVKALGANVYKASQPEVGWDDIRLSEDSKTSALFRGITHKTLKVLQWHEDTFDLPEGSVHLASSRAVPNQAFAFKNRLFGFQFHIEVDRAILEDWFHHHEQSKDIINGFDIHSAEFHETARQIYKNFFNLIQS